MNCWGFHRWMFPQAQGVRDRSGRFWRTGPDIQACSECAKRREPSLQFGRVVENRVVDAGLVEVAAG